MSNIKQYKNKDNQLPAKVSPWNSNPATGTDGSGRNDSLCQHSLEARDWSGVSQE